MADKPSSYSELLRQQQEIASRLEQARQAALSEARQQIESILTANGFTLDEVFPRSADGTRGRACRTGAVRRGRHRGAAGAGAGLRHPVGRTACRVGGRGARR